MAEGKLIACWSPWHGRGNTANAIAVATQFSMLKKAKIAITHSQFDRVNMECAFLNGKESDDILKMTDVGIDSLERALQTGKLTSNDFKTYCTKINEHLYFLPGSKKINKGLFTNSVGDKIKQICKYAKESNDLVFLDVSSGNDETAHKVLDMADIILVTLDQTNTVCEEFFKNEYPYYTEKKVIILLGRYDLDSIYTTDYVTKAYKVSTYGIPQLADYLDAINNHRVAKFFNTYYYMQDEPFIAALDEVVEQICDELEEQGVIFEDLNIPVTKKKGIFGKLLGNNAERR